jgi:hypothetical protein
MTNKQLQEIKARPDYDLLIDVFSWGVDYGQILMEQERDSEDVFDAFQCGIAARKFNVPSAIARRRQPHSKEWRDAKGQGLYNFIALMAGKVEV